MPGSEKHELSLPVPPEGQASTDYLAKLLMNLVAHVPSSSATGGHNPDQRAREIIRLACIKASLSSATCAAFPGPLGFATILPDLLNVWNIQRQMVADIAAVYGKTATLSKEMMLFCLFRFGAGVALRDMVVRIGNRLLVKETTLQTFQRILTKVGVKVTQKTLGSAISRWVPIAGSAGMGAYSYYDTRRVGKTAMESFSLDVELIPPPVSGGNLPPVPAPEKKKE